MTLTNEDRWEIAYEKHVEDMCTGAYLNWPSEPEPEPTCSQYCGVPHRNWECPELGQAEWPTEERRLWLSSLDEYQYGVWFQSANDEEYFRTIRNNYQF